MYRKNRILKRIHVLAGSMAFLILATFMTLTIGSELFCSFETVAVVKMAIPWGFLILVPALAITGASGFNLANGFSDLAIAGKKRRTPLIAAIGILVLSPSAAYLAKLASLREFDGAFYAVQALELVALSVNLSLMSLNIRDGLRLASSLPDTLPQPAE
jgi:hypothetical protein